MNRLPVTDSKSSLDLERPCVHAPVMSLYPYAIHCQRIDVGCNMARYYALSIRPTLFDETALVRCWGRIGTRGGEKTELFANEQEAALRFLELVRQKRRKGYRPVSTHQG